MKTVVGMFDTYAHAETATQDLENAGIPRNDISLVASNESEQFGANPVTDTTPHRSSMAHATVRDAEVGATIGGVLGVLAGASLFVIPGLGWLAGAGWFAGLLGGVAVGGIAGGLVGALTHIGVPEEDAVYYSEGVRRGGTLMTVRVEDSMAPRVAQILGDDGAVNIDERAAQWKQEGFVPSPVSTTATTAPQIHPTPATPITAPVAPVKPAVNTNPTVAPNNLRREGETVLPVMEEDLQVGKREVQRGGVRVYTHVTEKPVQENVTLREEHVNVERRPVDRPISNADMANLQDRTIEVKETAEEAIINKQARVVEEVVINKETDQRTETVRDTVRRTEVDVEPISGNEHVSRTGTTYETYANDFRNDWQRNYASAGGRYEDYEPSYRYGYDLYTAPQYQGKRWNEIEPMIQNDWNRRYPNSWDRMKNSIRYGYDRAASGRLPGEGSVPGIQTGGRALDGTPDTRGITEKIADAVTGDRIDDKTGKPI